MYIYTGIGVLDCCLWRTVPSAANGLLNVVLAVTVTQGEMRVWIKWRIVNRPGDPQVFWLVENQVDARTASNPALRFDVEEQRHRVLWLLLVIVLLLNKE